jgi:hypothetical protein
LGRVFWHYNQNHQSRKTKKHVRGREPLLETSINDQKTRAIEKKTKMPVGILLDKEKKNLIRFFLYIFFQEDVIIK